VTDVELLLFAIMLILMADYVKNDRAFMVVYNRIRHILLVSVRFVITPIKERILAYKERKALEELDLQEPAE